MCVSSGEQLLTDALADLARERGLFHSEADLQLVLAWVLQRLAPTAERSTAAGARRQEQPERVGRARRRQGVSGFRLTDGAELYGALSYRPTDKKWPGPPITLRARYPVRWQEFSRVVPGRRTGTLRALRIPVGPGHPS
jgi:hypothetical protein